MEEQNNWLKLNGPVENCVRIGLEVKKLIENLEPDEGLKVLVSVTGALIYAYTKDIDDHKMLIAAMATGLARLRDDK